MITTTVSCEELQHVKLLQLTTNRPAELPMVKNLTIDKHSNLRGWAAAQPFKGSIEPLRLECLSVYYKLRNYNIYGPDTASTRRETTMKKS